MALLAGTLIVLIALGESVVAVGIGVQGRELTAGVVVTSVLSLALAAALEALYPPQLPPLAHRQPWTV